MKLLKEPIDVDFSMRSEPWKEEDLAEFRELMKRQKAAYLASEKRKAKRRAKKTTKAS